MAPDVKPMDMFQKPVGKSVEVKGPVNFVPRYETEGSGDNVYALPEATGIMEGLLQRPGVSSLEVTSNVNGKAVVQGETETKLTIGKNYAKFHPMTSEEGILNKK